MARKRTNKNSKPKNTKKTRRIKSKQDNKLFLIFASMFIILIWDYYLQYLWELAF